MTYDSTKYKSDALEAAHTAAVGLFRAGEMDAERMHHFDKGCLVDPKKDATVRIHPETRTWFSRNIRSETFAYNGEKVTLDMSGWYPCDPNDKTDAIYVGDDMKPVSDWLIERNARR